MSPKNPTFGLERPPYLPYFGFIKCALANILHAWRLDAIGWWSFDKVLLRAPVEELAQIGKRVVGGTRAPACNHRIEHRAYIRAGDARYWPLRPP